VPRWHTIAHVTPDMSANLLDTVEIRMEPVKAHTCKDLVEQAEIADKSVKKFEPSVPKNKWVATPRDMMQPNLPNQSERKLWPLSYQGQLN